jgi:hypothetical protein
VEVSALSLACEVRLDRELRGRKRVEVEGGPDDGMSDATVA